MVKIPVNGIVVVEGKTDTQQLQRYFDVLTIATNGFAVSQRLINCLKLLSQHYRIILCLDPDGPGKKITARLLAALPNAKVIAIDKRWFKNQSKIGLAELDEKHMRNLFNDLIGELTVKPTLTWNDYQALPLDTRNARIQLCAKLSIPYFNHLQLFKILNLLKFNQAKIKYII